MVNGNGDPEGRPLTPVKGTTQVFNWILVGEELQHLRYNDHIINAQSKHVGENRRTLSISAGFTLLTEGWRYPFPVKNFLPRSSRRHLVLIAMFLTPLSS